MAVPALFPVSVDDFIIEAPIVNGGVFIIPDLIGDNATLPSSFFTGTKIGNAIADSINIQLPRSFAEAKEGIPKRLLRKDVIEQMYIIELDIFNFNAVQMGFFMNRRTQLNYAITTPSPGYVDIMHIGTSSPCGEYIGISLKSRDTKCPSRIYEWNMYAAISTAEDNSATYGDSYPVFHMKLEATPNHLTGANLSFGETGTDPQDNLGNWWKLVA